MSTATRVIKNTGYLYAKMGITMFISLYTTRLILNSLGASDFGIFNIVGGAIAMLGFLNAAMASATQRFMSYSEGEGNKEKQKSIFNISLVLHFGIAFAVGIALVIAGYFFFNGILNIPTDRIFAAKVVYGSLIVSTMFTVMTVPYDAAMNAHENMKYYAIVGIFESLLKLAVAFACVYTNHDKLIVYGSLMACIPLITLTIMRVYCHRHYEECTIQIKKYWDKGLMKEMTSFAGWSFLGSASSLIGNYGNGLVLNHFWGTLLNAAQGVANQLNGILLVFSNNMLKALNPVITKTEGAGNREKMLETTTTGSKFSFYMLAVFAIPAIAEMPYLLGIWLKNVPQWAVIFAQLQLVRTLVEQTTITLSTSLSAEGHIKRINQVTSIINLLPIILISILFSCKFSPIYMYAVNISIFGILLSFCKIYFMKTHCGMTYKYYTKNILVPILLTLIPSCLCSHLIVYFMEEGFLRLVLTSIVSATIYILTIYHWGITRQERMIFIQLINKIRHTYGRYKS